MPTLDRPAYVVPGFRGGKHIHARRLNEIVDGINRPNIGTPAPRAIQAKTRGREVLLTNLTITIDGGGSAITTSSPTMGGATVQVPCACMIMGWTVESDASGSIAIDVTRANKDVPSESIVGSGTMPGLSSAQYADDTPTSWTSVNLAQGDVLGFSVASATTVQRVTLSLTVAY